MCRMSVKVGELLKKCISCPVYQELREIGRRLGECDEWEVSDDNKTRRKSKYSMTDEELQIMKRHGVSKQLARRRMHNGMPREQAIRMSPDTRRAWTPDEDVKMLQLLASGKTYKQAAKKLSRSINSVERRASRLRRGEVKVNL